jgi:hypothetical protein
MLHPPSTTRYLNTHRILFSSTCNAPSKTTSTSSLTHLSNNSTNHAFISRQPFLRGASYPGTNQAKNRQPELRNLRSQWTRGNPRGEGLPSDESNDSEGTNALMHVDQRKERASGGELHCLQCTYWLETLLTLSSWPSSSTGVLPQAPLASPLAAPLAAPL